MPDFLTVALRNAARGFRVIPLRGKEAFLRNWPQLASTDETRIREWAGKFPNYNCGVAGGPDFIILDSDRVSRLKEFSGERCSEWLNTYAVSSGRAIPCHRTRQAGQLQATFTYEQKSKLLILEQTGVSSQACCARALFAGGTRTRCAGGS
jgi:hypothetical protein